MKYKLINLKTKEEHICEKVTIDGMDYYVSDEQPKDGEMVLHKNGTIGKLTTALAVALVEGTNEGSYVDECKKVICSTNPNIDIPKVVELLDYETNKYLEITEEPQRIIGFALGYNKSQETHPFSEEDLNI